MKITPIRFALATALLCAPTLHAQNFTFNIDLKTSALVSAPNSPFFLDFQLNEGSATVPNMATVSNFTFTNGNATGSPTTFGAASGNMGGSITLNDSASSPFNEIFQGFSSGTSDIKFTISLSVNPRGNSPDIFAVAILDSESNNPAIVTNAPDMQSLVIVPINSPMSLAAVNTYSSTSPAGVTAAASVPEPSSIVVLVSGVTVLLGLRRKRS